MEESATPVEGALLAENCVGIYRRLVAAIEERNGTVAVQAMKSLLN